ncbi:MAG: T9SS type A sorting domain-containing protein [Bacteroidota bacterium]
MKIFYAVIVFLLSTAISLAQDSYTEDFEIGDRGELIRECWSFSSTAIKSNDAIEGYSVRSGQLTNSTNPHKIGTPCTFFDGNGSVAFDHKISTLAGNNYKRLDLVIIGKEESATIDTLMTYFYESTLHSRDTVPINKIGSYSVEWRWIGKGGQGRAILDNVVVTGSNIADSDNGCACKETTFPVEWADVALTQEKPGLLLSWSTSQEVNNWMFEVERSLGGKAFERVEMVQGAVNSQSLQRYSFTDQNVLSQVGQTVVYRIKQIDLDGQFSYSPVVETQVREIDFDLEIFPNPTSDWLNLRWGNKQTVHSVAIVDATGKRIYTKEENLQSFLKVNVSHWQSGVYVALLYTSAGIESEKLVIQ